VDIRFYPNSMKYMSGRSSKSERKATESTHVAILGLGYVGLPTALSLHRVGFHVTGIDISPTRLEEIRGGRVDAASVNSEELASAISGRRFGLTDDLGVLADAEVVIIAVPTPVDDSRTPDVRALESACSSYIQAARSGQTVILTSTTYVGCTTALLSDPLRSSGFEIGSNLHVAFSPERLNPGSSSFSQSDVPRVIGGVTAACSRAAASVLRSIASSVHLVSTPEVAEMTKLVENTFRAVNIALANEFAEAASVFDIDVREVLDASASKPYGFMSFRPGPGVGGHCIPCDPHYLLWGLHSERKYAPVMEQAMISISARPLRVVDRIEEVLREIGSPLAGSTVLLVGMSYKPGVRDFRESPSVGIATLLRRRGASVIAYDPLLDGPLQDGDGRSIAMIDGGDASGIDLAVVLTEPVDDDLKWLKDLGLVLDASFALDRSETVVSL